MDTIVLNIYLVGGGHFGCLDRIFFDALLALASQASGQAASMHSAE